MTDLSSPSPALPIAHAVLRILVILNWIGGGAILALLLLAPNREWIIEALKLSPSLEADRVVFGLRAIASLGLVAVLLNHRILKRLIAMVDTVRHGDPFVASNADRLRDIGWALLVLQILSLVIAAGGKMISTPDHPVNLDAGFSINGWLAVLLTFVLARVFAAGAAMRDDLEGTV